MVARTKRLDQVLRLSVSVMSSNGNIAQGKNIVQDRRTRWVSNNALGLYGRSRDRTGRCCN